jgi:catalase
MAVKFSLPHGATTDIVGLSLPVFFVRTPEDFHAFVVARTPDPQTGRMDMEKVGAFVAAHPETQAALGLIFPALAPPVSFATRAYNAIHAVWLVGPDGERRAGRWRFAPEEGEQNLSPEEAKERPPDYLCREIAERGESRFRLELTLAAEGDPLDDATAAWPEDREVVHMGTLVVTGPDTTRERDGDVLVFDPTRLTDGIELSDDPLPQLRSDVYALSVLRRTGVARATA